VKIARTRNKNPVEIAQNAIKHAKANGFNVVIVDTAGRLAVDQEMMDEIVRVHDDQTTRNIVCCGCNDWSRCRKYSKGFQRYIEF
jgi:signal recognition particle GTPase